MGAESTPRRRHVLADPLLTFRLDAPVEAFVRLIGVAWCAPWLLLRRVLPHLLRWPRRLEAARPWRLVADWVTGRASVHYLNLVTHHLMSAPELRTPAGQERLAACAVRVPVDGALVSMCAVNALGVRERYYQRLGAPASDRAPTERRSP